MGGLKIEPNEWYTEDQLRLLGRPFDSATLAAARKDGQLKCREPVRGRRVYRGAWLLAWLESEVPA